MNFTTLSSIEGYQRFGHERACPIVDDGQKAEDSGENGGSGINLPQHRRWDRNALNRALVETVMAYTNGNGDAHQASSRLDHDSTVRRTMRFDMFSVCPTSTKGR